MVDPDPAAALTQSVEHVLETMCYCLASSVPGSSPGTNPVSVMMAFDGSHSGLLRLSVDTEAAEHLTAEFLGRDSSQSETVSELEINGTLRELGKVICGHFLSGLDPSGKLSILPETRRTNLLCEPLERAFQVPKGCLAVSVQFA